MKEPRPTFVDTHRRLGQPAMHRAIPLARAARRSIPAAKIIHVSYWGSVSGRVSADAQRPSERSLMLTPSPPACFRLVRPTCPLGEAPVRSTAFTLEDHALMSLPSPESPSQAAYL
ncbi:hypothetical protein OIDMADRAFT_182345 [Oidiodendron maius Zn]|uniref:Uncharacterized protein n=1 Tax=Oidiodendron maius (strain Zn) TaxID=913774 RepID=A0A0C3H696_OIDMZ|nr:hypothetical protein OIDMADRAFT_182345 [Oidiodendron maius Zn]